MGLLELLLFTQKDLEKAVASLQRCLCLPGATPSFSYHFRGRAHLTNAAAFGSSENAEKISAH